MRTKFKLNFIFLGLALLFVTFSLALDGCPALIIPSLAYQGYKYEKSRQSGSATNGGQRKNSSPSNQAASDNSIE